MIKLKTDGISLVFEDDELKLQRNLRIDKVSGEIRIMEYDTTTGDLVQKISCGVFQLESIENVDKYAKQIAEIIIESEDESNTESEKE